MSDVCKCCYDVLHEDEIVRGTCDKCERLRTIFIREFLDKHCPVTSDGYYMVFIDKKELEGEEE